VDYRYQSIQGLRYPISPFLDRIGIADHPEVVCPVVQSAEVQLQCLTWHTVGWETAGTLVDQKPTICQQTNKLLVIHTRIQTRQSHGRFGTGTVSILKQIHYIAHSPSVVRDTSFHRGGNAQGLVNLGEVVVDEV
jgi:hypothetical protein